MNSGSLTFYYEYFFVGSVLIICLNMAKSYHFVLLFLFLFVIPVIPS
jgi:hypothetical protein